MAFTKRTGYCKYCETDNILLTETNCCRPCKTERATRDKNARQRHGVTANLLPQLKANCKWLKVRLR